MLTLYQSSISHEMMTPLKAIILVTQQVMKQVTNPAVTFDLEIISNTSNMLLNQVKGNLDKNLLDANCF